MDSITTIRQMMAESKFFDAQKEAEFFLSTCENSKRIEVLPLYLEILLSQKKPIKPEQLLEVADHFATCDANLASNWVEKLSNQDAEKYFLRVAILRIKLAEKKGLTQKLYELISNLQVSLFERSIPMLLPELEITIQRYFKKDFHLNLQRLALLLALGDSLEAEKLVQELLFNIVEKASPKGVKEKYLLLHNVLTQQKDKSALSIYKNFCAFMWKGLKDKKDLKKLAEIIIYFDDVRLQSQVLTLIHEWDFSDVCQDYALVIKKNPQYSFVYFDKYFPRLKAYFYKSSAETPVEKEALPKIDLTLGKSVPSEPKIPAVEDDHLPEAIQLQHYLKHQNFSPSELLELSTSFLQAQLPEVALKASSMAKELSPDDATFMKACYLLLTCQLQTRDYRAALDTSMEALERAHSQDDVLSFLYGQAEAFQQLKKVKDAQRVLKRILAIDANYRLARERLERLNEI